jgi:hypothetical protein
MFSKIKINVLFQIRCPLKTSKNSLLLLLTIINGLSIWMPFWKVYYQFPCPFYINYRTFNILTECLKIDSKIKHKKY